ncbi:MAG TPA: carboxypeptidase-like regulatory domain-containing protein, partial [Planctomycetota bacterium]|nr:carboxypeptidase-like regulatory domain-containing protein [Planctomycetota bacterium]
SPRADAASHTPPPGEARETRVSVKAESPPGPDWIPLDAPPAEVLFLEPGEALLRVRVVAKETSEPLPDTRVLLSEEASGARTYVNRAQARPDEIPRTGADGCVEFLVPQGRAFQIEVPRDRDAVQHVGPLAEGQQHVVLLRVGTQADFVFFGRVVAAGSGRAVPGAAVEVFSREAPERVAADRKGRFELRGTSWRADVCRTEAAGFAPAYFLVRADLSTRGAPHEVRLSRAAKLLVRVVHPSGAPLAGAKVQATTDWNRMAQLDGGEFVSPSSSPPAPEWTATTDGDGRCALEGLPASVRLDLELKVRGSMTQIWAPLKLRSGEERALLWVSGGGVEVKGRVLDQFDAPVVRQLVRVVRPEFDDPVSPMLLEGFERSLPGSRTDAEGRFTIRNVPPGTWLIGPTPAKYPTMNQAAPANPVEGGPPPTERVATLAIPIEVGDVPPPEILLRADRGLYLRGRVVDSSGVPVEQGHVDASSHDQGWTYGHLSADLDRGGFALGPLPAGRWWLTVQNHKTGMISDPVEAASGQEGLLLTVKASCRVEGEVVAGSARQGGAQVTICERGGLEAICTLVQARDGEFRARGLPPGTYGFLAQTEGGDVGWVAGVELAEARPRSGVRVELRRGARLRVVNASGRSGWFGAWLEGYVVAAAPLEEGEEIVVWLPSGRAELRLRLGEVERPFELELAAGEQREVRFEGGGD